MALPIDATLMGLAKDIHKQNLDAGWWDEFMPFKISRYDTAFMLIVTELAEACEGYRRNLQDDHLPDYKMLEVELADAAIRTLDLCGAYNVTLHTDHPLYQKLVEEVLDSTTQNHNFISMCTVVLRRVHNEVEVGGQLGAMMVGIQFLFDQYGNRNLELLDIVHAKRAYNAQRADHKREARDAEGGKKY